VKKIRIMSMVIAIVFLLVSLGVFAEGANEAAPEGDKTIVLSSRLWSTPTEQKFIIDEIIKPFEEATGYRVNFQILDDDTLLQRAELQTTTGHVSTDIVIAYNARMAEWIDAGYIVDMTDTISVWNDRTFSTTFENTTNKDGKQYFIPVGADVYLLLANKKALPYLPAGADVQELSWAEYAQWANNVAKGEGEGKAVVTGVPMKSLVYQFGGLALSYGAGFPEINTPGAVEAWKVFASMKDAFIKGVFSVDNCTNPMLRGEAWLTVFHNARAGQVYSSNETQYVVAPAPSGPAGIGSIAGCSGYAIMKDAPNPDGAIAFLEYITRPDIQVLLAKGTGGFIPPVQEAIEYVGNDPQDEIITKAISVLENGVVSGVPGGDFQDWGAVKQVFDDVFKDMIINGNGSIDMAMLDAANDKLNALRK
jgi:multiple sugar transport system substrate-binding protein